MSRLTIFRDDAFLEEHVLMRAVVALGRHPENDIVLDDRTLSRFHARLERRGDRYVVVDLGAQNGVYLNGNRITGEHELVPGDRIGLGRYVAIFDQANASPSRRRGDRKASGAERVSPSGDAARTLVGDDDEADAAARALSRDIADEDDLLDRPTSPVEAARRLEPTLVLLYNGLEVSRHLLLPEKPVIVGRSKTCDVVIGLLGLSRRHARITWENGVVTVSDLGSQNGTWVNNARIEGAHPLQHGDLLNFYEYGLLFLEDPDVDIGAGVGTPLGHPVDELEARVTGRQAAPPVQSTSQGQAQSKPAVAPRKRSKATATRRTVAPVDDDSSAASEVQLEALDLGEGSFLGEAFDDVMDDFASSLAEEAPVDEGTDVLRGYPAADDEDDELGTATNRVRGRVDDDPSDSQTSTVRGRQRAGRWPTDVELEDALSQPGSDRLASLEVYLGERLFTQVPLSNPVTRIGADPRCELALPPRAKLRPWHVTLVHFGGATLCIRGSRDGRVRVGGADVDQIVLRDGDAIDLGTVRVVYRCR